MKLGLAYCGELHQIYARFFSVLQHLLRQRARALEVDAAVAHQLRPKHRIQTDSTLSRQDQLDTRTCAASRA